MAHPQSRGASKPVRTRPPPIYWPPVSFFLVCIQAGGTRCTPPPPPPGAHCAHCQFFSACSTGSGTPPGISTTRIRALEKLPRARGIALVMQLKVVKLLELNLVGD